MRVESQVTQQRGLFKYENKLLLILGLTFGVVFFDRQAGSILTPFLVPQLGLNNTQVGLLASVLSITWALAAYAIGRLSDAVGARKSFLVGFTVLFSLSSILSGLAPSFSVLLISRSMMGLAEGPLLPICLAIIVMESSPQRRGFNTGVVQNLFSTLFASVVAPVLLIALANKFGWRAAFFIAGVPGLLCASASYLWVREPPRTAPALEPTHDLQSVDVAQDTASRLGVLQLIRERNIWLCCIISVCVLSYTSLLFSFLPLYLTQIRQFSTTTMSVLLSVAGLAGPAAFLVPSLSDRLGRKPLLAAVAYLGMLAPLGALLFHGPIFALAILQLPTYLALGLSTIFMGIVPGESISVRYASTVMGLVICTGEVIGGFVVPTFAGWMADQTSLKAPMIMAAAGAFLAGTFALLLKETAPAKVRRRAQATTEPGDMIAPIEPAPTNCTG
jgi:predicted MFS family arabinose efflux permease